MTPEEFIKTQTVNVIYSQNGKHILEKHVYELMQEYADQLLILHGVSKSAIEQAKIEATKRIKTVVEVALHEYTTALNNGRCDECGDSLAKGEKATCEDCLCPE